MPTEWRSVCISCNIPRSPVPSLDLTAQPRLAPVGTQPVDVRCYDQLLMEG